MKINTTVKKHWGKMVALLLVVAGVIYYVKMEKAKKLAAKKKLNPSNDGESYDSDAANEGVTIGMEGSGNYDNGVNIPTSTVTDSSDPGDMTTEPVGTATPIIGDSIISGPRTVSGDGALRTSTIGKCYECTHGTDENGKCINGDMHEVPCTTSLISSF